MSEGDTPESREAPACLACGACCFGDTDRYVPVSGDDHARLGEAAEALTIFLENRCFMRMEHGHCAALRIEPGGRFLCTVYEQRPDVCRELARGGPVCAAERARKHEHAQAARLPLLTAAPFSDKTSR
jgi:Fe-S-cluster containining protein